MRVVALLFGVALSMSAPAGEFDQPWQDPNATLVIDPFHANAIDWEKLATEPRVVAVIHYGFDLQSAPGDRQGVPRVRLGFAVDHQLESLGQ